jgi:hemolysin D
MMTNAAHVTTTTNITPAAAAIQRHPAFDLLSRYKAILGAAWTHRVELAGPRRLADEAAFLPAALSLQDTPVHPAPRRFAFGIIVLFIIALVWSIVGKVDIVAIAPGRIIVSERTKLIQPLEASVVRRVLVKDGDTVQAGQVLVELDPTMANADKASVQEQLNASRSEMVRTAALLHQLGQPATNQKTLLNQELLRHSGLWLQADLAVNLASNQRSNANQSNQATSQATQAQLQSEWMDIAAKLAKLDAEATRRSAEMATVKELIAKLQATLPMAQTREADFKRLVGEGFISSHATQDKTRDRVELERDLATQQARLIEASAALAETQQAKAAYKAETQRQLNDRSALATSKLQQLTQESAKSGTVQQLAVHSIGGVVTPAQPLMVIVPDSGDGKSGTGGITAEVMIANQDIGFINAGQMAEVKLETFPYTQYGTVKARVAIVTADAVVDDRKGTDGKSASGGAVYPAALTLSQKDMLIDGKRVKLTPGMAVTAEIKTGQRRVIEYLLSPVQRAGSESLRER